jgi:hypothetical protein
VIRRLGPFVLACSVLACAPREEPAPRFFVPTPPGDVAQEPYPDGYVPPTDLRPLERFPDFYRMIKKAEAEAGQETLGKGRKAQEEELIVAMDRLAKSRDPDMPFSQVLDIWIEGNARGWDAAATEKAAMDLSDEAVRKVIREKRAFWRKAMEAGFRPAR